MRPTGSSNGVPGHSRTTAKYVHSPYAIRSIEEPTSGSPTLDDRRSTSFKVNSSRGSGNCSMTDNPMLPTTSSPLLAHQASQEASTPIQVASSAPNVQARYRRHLHSPTTVSANNQRNSYSASAFPTTPTGSLPPRSPFLVQQQQSGFAEATGGEATPPGAGQAGRHQSGFYAANHGNPLNASGTSVGAMGMSSSGGYPYRGGMPVGSAPNMYQAPPPPPGASVPVVHSRHGSGMTSPKPAYQQPNPSYAPAGFPMPPPMSSSFSGGQRSMPSSPHGVHSPQMPDGSASGPVYMGGSGTRYSTSPLTAPGRESAGPGGGLYSPTQAGGYGAGTGANPAHENSSPMMAPAGPGPYGNYGSHPHVPPPTQQYRPAASPHSPGTDHGSPTVPGSTGADPRILQGGNRGPTDSGNAYGGHGEESSVSSVKSCSSASSVRDDLPLCPNDGNCALINDRKHQRKFVHTCRLNPCFHGHIARHAKLFRHAENQIARPEGADTTRLSTHALASVNFSTISPEAPNAYRIYVSHGDRSYEIFGDWASVKVHTFKRYLHQVYHIPPQSQVLVFLKLNKIMDDDISTVKSYGIDEDAVIQLKDSAEDHPLPLRVPLDDL